MVSRRQIFIAEPQNGWVWKGPLGLSGPGPAQVRSRAGCPGPCTGILWRSSKEETPESLRAASSTCPAQQCCLIFRQSLVCPRCFLSWHQAPLKRSWPHLLRTMPAGRACCTALWWVSCSPQLCYMWKFCFFFIFLSIRKIHIEWREGAVINRVCS